jgi:fructose-1,6-bisphosphatase/inositol monophosphatase family enzyme
MVSNFSNEDRIGLERCLTQSFIASLALDVFDNPGRFGECQDGDVAALASRAIEITIVKHLETHYPDYAIVGHWTSKNSLNPIGTVYINPIDNLSNCARGLPFGISVGFVSAGGTPDFSVISYPSSRVCLSVVCGRGVFLNSHPVQFLRSQRNCLPGKETVFSYNASDRNFFHFRRLVQDVNCAKPVVSGSFLYDALLFLRGSVDACIENCPSMADFMAILPVVAELDYPMFYAENMYMIIARSQESVVALRYALHGSTFSCIW